MTETLQDSDVKAIDTHSHFSTEKGFVFRTPKDLENAGKNFRRELEPRTEAEMVDAFREAGVRAILDYGFTVELSVDEIREYHDYADEIITKYPDIFIGFWVTIDPLQGEAALEEFDRCVEELEMKIMGFHLNGTSINVAASDDRCHHIYNRCLEYDLPVHINAGYTGVGAHHPGGKGLQLEYCHPRYIDELAATFPKLNIIAGRPAWPWQAEMIACLLHKKNVVGYELHGWKPEYIPDELQYEVSRRLQDKIMFGGDYPIFSYDELFGDWESMGLDQETLEKVYYKNAERIFGEELSVGL